MYSYITKHSDIHKVLKFTQRLINSQGSSHHFQPIYINKKYPFNVSLPFIGKAPFPYSDLQAFTSECLSIGTPTSHMENL